MAVESTPKTIASQPIKWERASRQERQQIVLERVEAAIKTSTLAEQDKNVASVYLLTALTDNDRPLAGEAEIMKLLRCSPAVMKAAKKDAAYAVKRQSGLGTIIQSLARDIINPEKTKKGQSENAEDQVSKLQRLCRAAFIQEKEDGNKNVWKQQDRLARMAMMYIARWGMKETIEEAAKIAQITNAATIEHLMEEARQEYAARNVFYNNANSICKELGINIV